jgi:[acyl-carrier-protein] S-malonyltransferase
MQPAQDELAEAIRNTPFHSPICPIYQNVNAKAVTDPETIRTNLIAQLTAPVKWTQTIEQMIQDGVDSFIEVGGSGAVLRGMIRKINKEVSTEAL